MVTYHVCARQARVLTMLSRLRLTTDQMYQEVDACSLGSRIACLEASRTPINGFYCYSGKHHFGFPATHPERLRAEWLDESRRVISTFCEA